MPCLSAKACKTSVLMSATATTWVPVCFQCATWRWAIMPAPRIATRGMDCSLRVISKLLTQDVLPRRRHLHQLADLLRQGHPPEQVVDAGFTCGIDPIVAQHSLFQPFLLHCYAPSCSSTARTVVRWQGPGRRWGLPRLRRGRPGPLGEEGAHDLHVAVELLTYSARLKPGDSFSVAK